MAKVTTKDVTTTYVLELNDAEARYVKRALSRTTPAEDLGEGTGQDTVWDALDVAGVLVTGYEL